MVAELYTYVVPTVAVNDTPVGATTNLVGPAPQWDLEDGDSSYVVMIPAGAVALFTFNIGIVSCPGLTEEWFDNPHLILSSQAMGFQSGDPLWRIWLYGSTTPDEMRVEFEPFRGYYLIGESTYSTNVFHARTAFPGPDPEDPHGDVITYEGDEYSTFVQYGIALPTYDPDTSWGPAMYQAYLANEAYIQFEALGGTGDGVFEDELRISLFGLVLPSEIPNLEGEFEANRRQFWRTSPY